MGAPLRTDLMPATAPLDPLLLDPTARCFRYAVKTDRAGAVELRRMAHAAGVSVEIFVQAAFERLLGRPDPLLRLPGVGQLHASFGVSRLSARLLRHMMAEAAADGTVHVAMVKLQHDLDLTAYQCAKQLEELGERGLIETVARRHGGGTVYRITSTKRAG